MIYYFGSMLWAFTLTPLKAKYKMEELNKKQEDFLLEQSREKLTDEWLKKDYAEIVRELKFREIYKDTQAELEAGLI